MFRKIIVASFVALLVAGVGSAGEKPWFDMENCAMCEGMVKTPGLMESITWEQYDISNGIVCVNTVPKGNLEAYRAAHKHMEETGARLQKGEMLNLCGSCTALGAVMMKGVKEDYVQTKNGDVWIVTSDKPEVVAELHGWAKRNKDEMAKMEEMMKMEKKERKKVTETEG